MPIHKKAPGFLLLELIISISILAFALPPFFSFYLTVTRSLSGLQLKQLQAIEWLDIQAQINSDLQQKEATPTIIDEALIINYSLGHIEYGIKNQRFFRKKNHQNRRYITRHLKPIHIINTPDTLSLRFTNYATQSIHL